MKTIACLIFPHFQSLDVSGPLDVFSEANAILPAPDRYALTTVAAQPGPVIASNGLQVLPDLTLDDPHPGFDTIIIAGGPQVPHGHADARVLEWLARVQPQVRRCCSICTGAFILGQAGLLRGQQATTHWLHTDLFRARFAQTELLPDRIYVRSGNILTSAGVTAGIDLSLALVRDDHGAELALQIAKRLLVVAHRQGGQSQFSPLLAPLPSEDSPLQQAIDHIHRNIHLRVQNSDLAAAAGMTPRTFCRSFMKELHVTPAEYVERYRVEIAKMKLESSRRSMKEIAFDCGFGSTETMRQAFMRRIGLPPSQYRQVFAETDQDGSPG